MTFFATAKLGVPSDEVASEDSTQTDARKSKYFALHDNTVLVHLNSLAGAVCVPPKCIDFRVKAAHGADYRTQKADGTKRIRMLAKPVQPLQHHPLGSLRNMSLSLEQLPGAKRVGDVVRNAILQFAIDHRSARP